MQLGFIPNLCYAPTPGGSGQTGQSVDLFQTLESIKTTVQDVVAAIQTHDSTTSENHTELIDLLTEWQGEANNPILLPSEVTQLITDIREHLAVVRLELPELMSGVIDQLRENALKVVSEFSALNTAQQTRHDELIAKLSLKRTKKVTKYRYVDARQFKVTINLPEGALGWSVYPICQVGDQLVQDVAHTYSIGGEQFNAGEVASDAAVTMGSTVATLEARAFEFPAGGGRFRFAWEYAENLGFGEVTETVEDDAPTSTVLDEGTAVDDGSSVEGAGDSQESDEGAPEGLDDIGGDDNLA